MKKLSLILVLMFVFAMGISAQEATESCPLDMLIADDGTCFYAYNEVFNISFIWINVTNFGQGSIQLRTPSGNSVGINWHSYYVGVFQQNYPEASGITLFFGNVDTYQAQPCIAAYDGSYEEGFSYTEGCSMGFERSMESLNMNIQNQ